MSDDLMDDPAVLLIEEPTESFDAWLHELQQGEPLDLKITGAALVAEARAESGYAPAVRQVIDELGRRGMLA